MKKNSLGVRPNNMHLNSVIQKDENNYLIIALIIIFTILFIVGLYLLTSFLTTDKNSIAKNIYIENIPMGGKTEIEAKRSLEHVYEYLYTGKAPFIVNDKSFTLSSSEINYFLDINGAIKNAINISKKQNFKEKRKKVNIPIEISYDNNLLEGYITEILKLIPKESGQDRITIQDNFLVIYKGGGLLRISREELKEIILNKFKSTNFNTAQVIPLTSSMNPISSIDQIYKDFKKEPKDAYIDRETGKIINEEYGQDFNISIEEAKQLYLSSKDTFKIPIKKIAPNVLASTFEKELFGDHLVTYGCKYDNNIFEYINPADKDKVTNLFLNSVNNLNGFILQNNSTLSLNSLAILPQNLSSYIKSSFSNLDLIQTPFSTLATSLYNVALRLNLDILEKHNHTYAPDFCDLGFDAYISNSKDLKFRNNRSSPIKFVIAIDQGLLKISVYGKKSTNEPKITLTSKIISQENVVKERKPNFNFGPEYTQLIQKGRQKTSLQTYKEISFNNESNGKTLLGTIYYKGLKEITEYGNKINKKEEKDKDKENQNKDNNTNKDNNGTNTTPNTNN